MIINAIWPTMTMLKAYILNNFDAFVASIASAVEVSDIPIIQSVEIGNDYTRNGLRKPFVMIDPVRSIPDDETVGIVADDLSFDILIAIDSYTDGEATMWVSLYADAFLSMILSDDTLGDQVSHASIEDREFFPGGTGTTKYVLLNLMISIETDRS